MIGYDDPYIAPCGKACETWSGYADHRKQCGYCTLILFREFGESPKQPENDAEDRGICYEDD